MNEKEAGSKKIFNSLSLSWEECPPFCNLMTLPRICSHRTSHLVTRCPIGHLRDHQRIAESMSDVRHFFRCQLLLMLDLKKEGVKRMPKIF